MSSSGEWSHPPHPPCAATMPHALSSLPSAASTTAWNIKPPPSHKSPYRQRPECPNARRTLRAARIGSAALPHASATNQKRQHMPHVNREPGQRELRRSISLAYNNIQRRQGSNGWERGTHWWELWGSGKVWWGQPNARSVVATRGQRAKGWQWG